MNVTGWGSGKGYVTQLKDVDVVLVQEVQRDRAGCDEALRAMRKLGWVGLFSPSPTKNTGLHAGVGVLWRPYMDIWAEDGGR